MVDPDDPARTWTLDEANAALGRVSEVVARAMRATDRAELLDAAEELARQGVLLRDHRSGLIDFAGAVVVGPAVLAVLDVGRARDRHLALGRGRVRRPHAGDGPPALSPALGHDARADSRRAGRARGGIMNDEDRSQHVGDPLTTHDIPPEGDDESDSAVHRAQAPGENYMDTTGDPDHEEDLAQLGIKIRGKSIETVLLTYPGLDEFEISVHEIKQWLEQTGLLRKPKHWSDLDAQLQAAIEEARSGVHVDRKPRPSGAGDGYYDWEEWAQLREHAHTDPERYAIDDEQSVAWNTMLAAWEQFRQHVAQLQTAGAGEDGDAVVRAVGDVITALKMVERDDWASPYTEEFGAWMGLDGAAIHMHSLRDAATDITSAGWDLYSQWQSAIGAGNYRSGDLAYPQHDFVKACTDARAKLVPKEAEPAGEL